MRFESATINDSPSRISQPYSSSSNRRDFRVLIDWDKGNGTLYAIDDIERKKEYRELGTYREVWGSWRDDK